MLLFFHHKNEYISEIKSGFCLVGKKAYDKLTTKKKKHFNIKPIITEITTYNKLLKKSLC